MNKINIEKWWNDNPQTYSNTHGKFHFENIDAAESFIKEMEVIDEKFWKVNFPNISKEEAFEKYFMPKGKQNNNGLEIGCGLGTLAESYSIKGYILTTLDLNQRAVDFTSKRAFIKNLTIKVLKGDAEALQFDDETFDFVVSWGVLMHTPQTNKAVEEIYRVLKPGGWCGVMLYHKNGIFWRILGSLWEGYLHYESKFLNNPHELTSRYYDGGREEGNPHTKVFSIKEAKGLFSKFSKVDVETVGHVKWIFRILYPKIWLYIPNYFFDYIRKHWGEFLWITCIK